MTRKLPRTTKEAIDMIRKGWMFLMKKYPIFVTPLTFWMVFGGFIFLYNYTSADKFEIKEAKPLGEITPSSFMPTAFAIQKTDGIPIIFNDQKWGYEDTTFIAKVAKDRPVLLVYDKISKKVYEIGFSSNRDVKMQLQQKR
jgi:hypothetical protein